MMVTLIRMIPTCHSVEIHFNPFMPMDIPFFYAADLVKSSTLELDEDTARHITQVLRMQVGERIGVTDGNGAYSTCIITSTGKKSCVLAPGTIIQHPPPAKQITVAMALLKNKSRMEWFFEKATELGVQRFVPLITQRTERQVFRAERMQGILLSAMLQSKQYRLPEMLQPVSFSTFTQQPLEGEQLIAHCEADERKVSLIQFQKAPRVTILIGPEGDFTSAEITQAMQAGYQPVSIGTTRLRTETAGVAAAVCLCI